MSSVKSSPETIDEFLADVEPKLKAVSYALLGSIKRISEAIRTTPLDKAEGGGTSFNQFGDRQLEIDVLSDKLMFDGLRSSECCEVASSEENPEEISMGGTGYSVAFDPLDGSSIFDTGFAVGTICGIWPGGTLIGVTGREMAGVMVSQYGPATTVKIALANKANAHEFHLNDDGSWTRTNEFTGISSGKMFAPGNLQCTQDNPGYAKIVGYWMANKYSLRYSGGMVPDVNQLLVKGRGVFVHPSSIKAPAKLRLLYEVMPMSMLVEKAGGKSSNGAVSILDLKTVTCEDRTQVALGSEEEVKRFDDLVGYSPPGGVVSKDDPNWVRK